MTPSAQGKIILTLDKVYYPRESVESAARVFEERLISELRVEGNSIMVVLRPVRQSSPRAARRLAGEFLNEALSHHLRQLVIRFNRALTGPELSAALTARFPSEPADPLEEMEPQVAQDRRAEREELLGKAGA